MKYLYQVKVRDALLYVEASDVGEVAAKALKWAAGNLVGDGIRVTEIRLLAVRHGNVWD